MSSRAIAGSVIEGKYRLERELGAGGMGSVWLATQLMVDRSVAIKLLHPSFVDSKDLQARFEVEAKAIGRLNHPNVITLYDFGFSEELRAFYTVIEYIDGVSLDKKLNLRLPLDEVCKIVRQIALALDHAHHFSILHRDLKPENVMLARMTDGSEMVKVLDFGIARIVKGTSEEAAAEAQRITKAGEVFGTPAYMSPEQARSVRSLTPAADLYSLGVILYELVEGALPFFAHSAFDLLMMHVTKPVPPLRRAGVPDELEAIILKLLDKDSEKRFQSGRALVAALDALKLPADDGAVPDEEEFYAEPTLLQKTPTPTLGTPPSGEYFPSLDAETFPLERDPSSDPSGVSTDTTRLLASADNGYDTELGVEERRRRAGVFGIVALLVFVFVGGFLVLWTLSSPGTTNEAGASEGNLVEAPIEDELTVEAAQNEEPAELRGDSDIAAAGDRARRHDLLVAGDPSAKVGEPAAVEKQDPAIEDPVEPSKEVEAKKPVVQKQKPRRKARPKRTTQKPKVEEKPPVFDRVDSSEGSPFGRVTSD